MHNIYNKNKILKRSRIIFKEEKSIERLKIVKSVYEKFEYKNVWTIN